MKFISAKLAKSLIKKYFNKNEIKGLLTSNYYSVLYYNSEILDLPTLSPLLKQKLLSASANALKLSLTKLPQNTSFESIHRLAKRATPTQMSNYKLALQLHKLYNSTNIGGKIPLEGLLILDVNSCLGIQPMCYNALPHYTKVLFSSIEDMHKYLLAPLSMYYLESLNTSIYIQQIISKR